MQYNYIALRPDRLNYPIDVFPVGRFSSAVLVFVGDVPADIASMKVLVGRTNDPQTGDPRSDFTIDAVRGDDGVFRAYMPPTCFPDVAELEYHVHGTDAEGNDRWLGTGPLRVVPGLTNAEGALPPPDTLPGYVRSFNGKTGAVTLVATDILTAGQNITIAVDGTISATGGSSVDVVPPSTSASASGKAADAKATGDALYSGFTEWEFSGELYNQSVQSLEWSDENERWEGVVLYSGTEVAVYPEGDKDSTSLSLLETDIDITATRHLITPTKTSQLENDGAPNCGGNEYVMTNDTRLSDERTPTAHRATHAANGSDPLAPADIGAAAATDLPYALVEIGAWEFTGVPEGRVAYLSFDSDLSMWSLRLDSQSGTVVVEVSGSADETSLAFVDFMYDGEEYTVEATRSFALLDRAVNAVAVSAATELTMPVATAGKARDFLVRMVISGSTVPTITFADPTGEEMTYETDGDEFPVPDEAGTWLYAFTETDASKFAVALKRVNVVAQGGAQ